MVIVAVAVFGMVSVKLVDQALARSDHAEMTPQASNERLVTIHDRDQERSIVTTATSVRQALQAADIRVDEQHDVVEPALDAELVSTKYSINIYRARPVTVIDGTKRMRAVTAQQTPAHIVQAAGVKLYPEDEITLQAPTNLLLDGADMIATIKRATPVQLNLYGKVAEVRTMARTVGDLLREKNVTLGKDDTVSLPVNTPITPNMQLSVWRNGKQTVTVEEEIATPVEQVKDANRETGFKEVKEPGEPGKKNVTYEIEMRNGQEVSRKVIAEVTTKEPKKRVEIVGVKTQLPAGSHTDWMAQAGISESQFGYVNYLVSKESGWRVNAQNPSGAYGLPQALPGSKMASAGADWRTNPVTQLRWMNGYVMGRYGSWEAAVAHSKAKGWY